MEKKTFDPPLIKKLNAGMPSKFGMTPRIEPVPEVEGHRVKHLLEEFGSPLYVLSENTLRSTFRQAFQAFSTRYPKVQFAWSYKTNYLSAVCNVFHQEGAWAEVVSGFEYHKALKHGVQPQYILFNGPSKTYEDLKTATENGSFIHIDHFDELYMLMEVADDTGKKPKVAIRVNMDTGIYPQWDRFGFNYDNGEAWEAINRIMLSGKMELAGLHTHIGTYIMTAQAYRVAASKLADLAVNTERKYGHAIRYIDLGGGFASKNTLKGAYVPGTDSAPSFDEYADAITGALVNSAIKPEHLPLLILETGRAMIDDAGYLLGTVIANKRLASGRRALITNVGVNLLFTSFWYEHQIFPTEKVSQHTEDTTIYGPLCMNIDVLRAAIDFPLLKKGDQFVIKRIGAYNMTQWLQFIEYRPNVVMIDTEGTPHIIRRKEDLDYMTRQEELPDHLKEPGL